MGPLLRRATAQFHAGPRWLSALKGATAAMLVQLATVLATERIGGVWFAMDPVR